MESTSRTNILQAQRRQKRALRAWKALIFLVVLAAEIIGAYYIVYMRGAIMNDAIARTANAYYVLFLEPHKLASIGFVWNPLPSLVQLLIIPFARFWQPLASSGFAGCIASALFASWNASLLFGYFKRAGTKTALSLLFVALYAFNPFIFYYGLNGMSETYFFSAMIICTANFALWMDQRRTGQLVAVGLMLAIGFLTRYETFALMLAVGLGMLIAVYLMEDKKSPFTLKPTKMKWDYSVATGTVLFLPVLYTIAMWMFLNWSIMGNPLFFFDSAYSNESQSSVALYSGFKEMVSNPFVAFGYVLERLLPFVPPFLVITAERIRTKRLIKADYLVLLMFVGGLIGFHYVMLVTGKSFGWLRFYCFVLVFSVAWIPYELTQLEGKIKKGTTILLCLSLALSAAMIPYYFQSDELAKEEHRALYGGDMSKIAEQQELAEKLNEKYADSKILMDAFVTSSVILNLKHPENLVTNIADDLFDLAVIDPHDQFIDYVVVPTNLTTNSAGEETEFIGGAGVLDAINQAHPRLYRYGADWADLVYQIWGFKLYKVLQWDEYTADLVAEIQSNYGGAVLLFDNSTTGMLRYLLKNPRNAITLMSKNFEQAVENPMQYDVEYIIVPKVPVDVSGSRDDILAKYPELMKGENEWTELVYENEWYNMYRVIYPEGWVKEEIPETDETGAEVTKKATAKQWTLANFLNAVSGRSLLLVDPAQEEALPGLLTSPESMFTSTSVGFEAALLEPERYQIRYMILPAKGAEGALWSVARLVPDIYEDGPAQATLVFENEAYRVYALLDEQGQAPDDGKGVAAAGTALPDGTGAPVEPNATATVTATAIVTVAPSAAGSATATTIATEKPSVTVSSVAEGTALPDIAETMHAAAATVRPALVVVPTVSVPATNKPAATVDGTATVAVTAKPVLTATATVAAMVTASAVSSAVAVVEPGRTLDPTATGGVLQRVTATARAGFSVAPMATAMATAGAVAATGATVVTTTVKPTVTPTPVVTSTATAKPTAAMHATIVTATATAKSTATPKPIATITLAPKPTATMHAAVVTVAATARPTMTIALTPTAKPTTMAAATTTTTPTATVTPTPTVKPTATAVAATTATATAVTPAATPKLVATSTATLKPTATMRAAVVTASTTATTRPTATVASTPTTKPITTAVAATTTSIKPTVTPTPITTSTLAPKPTATMRAAVVTLAAATTVKPTATPKPIATNTATPKPTATMHAAIITTAATITIRPAATVTLAPTTKPTTTAVAATTSTATPKATATIRPSVLAEAATLSPAATFTPTATAKPTTTVIPTATPTATATTHSFIAETITTTLRPTPTPEPTATAAPTATVTATTKPTPTTKPTASPTPTTTNTTKPKTTAQPTPASTPTAKPTTTPKPTTVATTTPKTTAAIQATIPTEAATTTTTPAATIKPAPTATTTPKATAQPTPTSTPTAKPTTTPKPTATATATPTATTRPAPPATPTPSPTPTFTATSTPGASPTVTAAIEATTRPYIGWLSIRVNGSGNVRKEGNVDAEVVHIVRDGDWYPVLSISESGWYEIRISNHISGYVSPKITSRIYRNTYTP